MICAGLFLGVVGVVLDAMSLYDSFGITYDVTSGPFFVGESERL